MSFTKISVCLCLLTLLGASPANAKNLHGKAALGIQRTLLEAQGITFAYWATPKVCVSFVLGAGFVNGEVEAKRDLDEDGVLEDYMKQLSSTSLLGAFGVKYVIYGTKFANLTVGFRADMGWASSLGDLQEDDTWKDRNDVTQFGFEIPLEVEYFLSDAVSINLATGATFTWIPDGLPEKLSLLGSTGIGQGVRAKDRAVSIGGGSIFSHIGVRFYF
jgi:hypothetical protein